MEWDKWPARYLCCALWGQNWGLPIKVTKGQLARARKNVLLLIIFLVSQGGRFIENRQMTQVSDF